MTVSPRALAAAGLNAGAGMVLAGAVACDVRAGAVEVIEVVDGADISEAFEAVCRLGCGVA